MLLFNRTYAGDYDYGSAIASKHLTSWADGRVTISGQSQQDAFTDKEPVARCNTNSDSYGNSWTDSAPGPGEKGGGNKYIASQMEGGDLGQHDVYRDGVVIATTPNDGLYDDSTGTTGQASFMYKVCEAGNPELL